MTSAPIKTIDDVLDIECDSQCAACSAPLDPPGSQCGACGGLPEVTREEARERLLEEPDAIARAEAGRLRDAAAEYLVAAERMFRMADAVEHKSELRRQRDELQVRLGDAVGEHERLLAALAVAEQAEQKAAKPLADAFAAHRKAAKAEETARRLRRGATAEADAIVRLQAAAQVLSRYKGEAAAAADARKAAEAAAEEAGRAVRDCEQERDWAQLVFERHPRVPLSRLTALALVFPALRMAHGADIDGRELDQAERGMFAVFGEALQGAALAEYAAALDRAEEERIKAKLSDEAKQQAQLRPVGDGLLDASWHPEKDHGVPVPGGVVTPVPNLSPASPFRNTGEGAFPGARP